jgi:hypothetical protein
VCGLKERVLMVWDIYDGVRSGVALYRGEPHYFDCEFEDEAGGYTDVFRLWPIDQHLLSQAVEKWQIYRSWELRFHSGEVLVETHPGNRGQNARYDEIEDQIAPYLQSLGAPAHRVAARFEAKEEQPELPPGCLREMEVTWLESSKG